MSACAVAVDADAVDVALAGVEVGGTRVAVGGTCVGVGGFVGVFSGVGTLVGDGCVVTCSQPGARTDAENRVVPLTASRAETTEGVSALPNTSKPSATLPAMVWRT